jgi:LacI family transcriptional regulator
MAKKYRIKDIAALAGVSVGTVDRVIHNRGDVSSDSRIKIEKVLAEINYPYGQHTAVPENAKQIKLLMILPQHTDGDYWALIEKGIGDAIRDFINVKLKVKFLYYDQFDLYSSRRIFIEALSYKSDAVIIGPSFYDETVLFASQLFMKNIPYVFVDAAVNNTKPLAFFGPHSFQTGVVQAKLLTTILEPGEDIAFFQAKRIGDEASIPSLSRSYGFISYLKDHFPDINVYSAQYDNADKKQSWRLLDQFFQEHTNIGGVVVFNTRAYVISEYLKMHEMKHVKLIGYGTDKRNVDDLKDGYISFIISERPYYQGYKAIRTIMEYLLYNKTTNVENYTPIDILIKETIDFYAV